MMISNRLASIAPLIFVTVWSTGWLVAAAVGDQADPLWFLTIRFFLVACILGLIVAFTGNARRPLPANLRAASIISGFFVHVVYLGGIFWAIDAGLHPAVSGVIAIVQPVTTVVIARLAKGERLGLRRCIGITIAIAALILNFTELYNTTDSKVLIWPVIMNISAMVAIAWGTYYAANKGLTSTPDYFWQIPLWQFSSASIFMLLLSVGMTFLGKGGFEFQVSLGSIIALAWSVIGMSLGATSLWWFINKNNAQVDASTLIFLIPPLVALEAAMVAFFFGDNNPLSQVQWLAIILESWLGKFGQVV
jgi:drug/metabolite transporter (DMT)-like permease